MATVTIRPVQPGDCEPLVKMQLQLWPEASADGQRQVIDSYLRDEVAGAMPALLLVAEAHDGVPIGFLEASLRSHADGCDPVRPTGYVEGWFVDEGYRSQGVGAALVRAAEDWARSHGCQEMASDVLIDNERSQKAHHALGFAEVDRCVHYRKSL
ncbi:MAG TPA: GNAT family N-acetyltransferase [Acidobacteriaceae bacterium]|jgi:aminoglycoside 6'-N-acetyltransferase I